MARVVSQRSGPPYLLIVFVFLFVISTAIAVLVYLELDEVRAALAESRRLEDKLASERERNSAEVARMLKNYDRAKARHERDPGSSPQPQSVFAQQRQTIAVLVEKITGNRADDPNRAVGLSRQAFARTGSDAGLAVQVLALKARLNDLEGKQMPERDRRIRKLETDLEAERKAFKALDANFAEQRATLLGRIGSLDARLKTNQKDYERKLDLLARQSAEKLDALNRRIAQLTAEMEKLQLRLREKDVTIAALRDEIRVRKGQAAEDEFPFRRALGKIVRVQEDDGICYIDLGRRDHVKPGLTFSVYPAAGFGDEASRKGGILVTSPLERVSVCRITDSAKDNPIMEGDLIENVAFDPAKVFSFVVEGDFNLSGEDAPSPQGAEEVKALIRRFGGKVTDALGPQTDFVVLGQAPARPSKPREGEDEPAQVRHVRLEQQKIWQRYHKVKRLARERRIPILNQNRFIALTGYHATEAR